jgi:hypothetical protein
MSISQRSRFNRFAGVQDLSPRKDKSEYFTKFMNRHIYFPTFWKMRLGSKEKE